MADKPHVLGIDLGTGGIRALLVDQYTGDIIGSASSDHSTSTPNHGWSEQDPEDWWRGCCSAIRTLLDQQDLDGGSIAAVGLSGQMHGLILLDERDAVIRPAILWNDQRTTHECDLMHEWIGRDRLIELTGKPAMTSFTAPKILWMMNHDAEALARTHSILLPKDHLRLRLTGERAMDVSDASGTSLLDLGTRQWSSEILERLHIEANWLPPILESQDIAGTVTHDAAAATGLQPGTPVVAGAGDQAAGGVGCGIGGGSAVSVNLGTSGVVFADSRQRPHDPTGALHGYCHAICGEWHVMGVMLSAGGSLKWYRDTFEGDDPAGFDRIIDGARTIRPGCDGLDFLPYLTGERTPHADPMARGAFVGMTNQHQRAHFGRAVLEGILFGLKDSLELIRQRGQDVRSVRMTGGGARSSFWRQMAADIFNLPVSTVNVTDGSAYGAALLAMVGSGRFQDVPEAMNAFVQETSTLPPSHDAQLYGDLHERWKELYPALAPAFHDR